MDDINKEKLIESIENILFDMGKNITIHRIDPANTIIDVPYNKYVNMIIETVDNYCQKDKQI